MVVIWIAGFSPGITTDPTLGGSVVIPEDFSPNFEEIYSAPSELEKLGGQLPGVIHIWLFQSQLSITIW